MFTCILQTFQCRGSGTGWPLLTSEVQAFEVIAKKFLTETGSSPFSTGKGFKKLHRMFESTIALEPAKDFYRCNRTLFSRTIEMECGYGGQ